MCRFDVVILNSDCVKPKEVHWRVSTLEHAFIEGDFPLRPIRVACVGSGSDYDETMQAPTHILAGVLIQRSFQSVRPRALRLGLTAVCAFLSHGLLDKLANATYHPPNANFHDPFWVCFHSEVLIVTILFLVIWWRQYKWGIFFAVLPDLDWVFIHGQEIFHLHLPFYHKSYMHHLLHIVFDVWPPFKWLHVPAHRFNPLACLYEAGLIASMLAGIYLLTKKKAPPTAAASESVAS